MSNENNYKTIISMKFIYSVHEVNYDIVRTITRCQIGVTIS